jgi:hypothetical protein
MKVRKFEVIKVYHGIKVGKKVGCRSEVTIKKMVDQGFWKEIK